MLSIVVSSHAEYMLLNSFANPATHSYLCTTNLKSLIYSQSIMRRLKYAFQERLHGCSAEGEKETEAGNYNSFPNIIYFSYIY